MNVFIVGAHPEPKSFNVVLRREAERFFSENNHKVVVSDLYAMNFNPVACSNDFIERRDPDYLVYSLEQRNSWSKGGVVQDIKVEVEKLMSADLFLMVFPLFWFSMPAMLKGWVDRVILSGPMFGGRRFYDRGPFKGKKAMIAITVGGREHMFGPNGIHGEMEAMIRHITRGTLQYIGFDVLPPFIGWHVPYVTNEVRKGYLKAFLNHLKAIDNMKPLWRPSLDDFDDVMRPIREE